MHTERINKVASFRPSPTTSSHHAYRTGTKTQRKIDKDMMNARDADVARRSFYRY